MHAIVRLAAALAIILVASPAHAGLVWLWGQEICKADTAVNMLSVSDTATVPWEDMTSSTPTNSTTTFGDSTNACSLRFNVPSGTAMRTRRGQSITTETAMCTMMYFRVATAPTTQRRILEFKDTTGSFPGAFLTLESSGGGAVVRSWFSNTDNECTTSNNDGTTCSSDAECSENNPGEASCSTGQYNQTGELDLNTWYVIGLEQSNGGGGAGNVQVGLYQGVPGAVAQMGSRTKAQGTCSGGDNNGWACASDTTCTGGGTCDTSVVRSIGSVDFGINDTVAAAADFYIDNIQIWDESCENVGWNHRIAAMYPTGDTGTNAWTRSAGTTWYELIDEVVNPTPGTAPDGDTTYVGTTTNNAQDNQTLSDFDETDTCSASVCTDSMIACVDDGDCMQADATIDGVSAVSSIRDVNNSAGANATTATVTPAMFIGASVTSGGGHFMLRQQTNGYQIGGMMQSTTKPGGGSWGASDLDSLGLRATFAQGSCTGGCQRSTRMSASIVEALIRLPQSAVPTVLPDNNGDTSDTVGIIGDSRINTPLSTGRFDGLIEADNLYDCAKGGATIGDMSFNIDGIRDGLNTGYLKCDTRKGTNGFDLDVAVVMIGINSYRSSAGDGGAVMPEITIACDANADCVTGGATCISNTCSGGFCSGTLRVCTTNVDCGYCTIGQRGYCADDGGADEGAQCYCPQTDWRKSDTTDADVTRYCTVSDVDYLAECTKSSDCICDDNTDCAPGSTCSGSPGNCSVGGGGGVTCAVNSNLPSTYCQPGCLGATGCADGLCITGNPLADNFAAYNSSVQTLLANNADVVLVMEPRAEIDIDPFDNSVQTGCWRYYNGMIGQEGAWLKALEATDADLHYVDAWSYLQSCCPNGDISECLQDGIHLDTEGEVCLAEAIMACLTNDGGTHDGVCTSNICTAGKKANVCSTDADCDTWNCAF